MLGIYQIYYDNVVLDDETVEIDIVLLDYDELDE
jgi:hypothetical protein